jgi:glycosyltransferase involved in cell wall biosynthesis
MRVLFVNYRDFGGNSGIHIFHLANKMVESGVDCTVAVPNDPGTVSCFGSPLFKSITYKTARTELAKPGAMDLIHAWTPRENTRRLTQYLVKHAAVPYVVHMEDNEENITASVLGGSWRKPAWWRSALLDIHPKGRYYSHPKRYKRFLAQAQGITLIFQTLEEYIPLGANNMTFWPACEPEFFDIAPKPYLKIRRDLDIPEEDMVLSYPGNIHRVNLNEVATLYETVLTGREQGLPLTLLRAGLGDQLMPERLANLQDRGWVKSLGDLSGHQMIKLMKAADVLVQPGQANEYNDFRLPSKLPMFLASQRPVLLPNSNLARYLSTNHNCIILYEGNTIEIVHHLHRLRNSPELSHKLAVNGMLFAQQNFSWAKSASMVTSFFERILVDSMPGGLNKLDQVA